MTASRDTVAGGRVVTPGRTSRLDPKETPSTAAASPARLVHVHAEDGFGRRLRGGPGSGSPEDPARLQEPGSPGDIRSRRARPGSRSRPGGLAPGARSRPPARGRGARDRDALRPAAPPRHPPAREDARPGDPDDSSLRGSSAVLFRDYGAASRGVALDRPRPTGSGDRDPRPGLRRSRGAGRDREHVPTGLDGRGFGLAPRGVARSRGRDPGTGAAGRVGA